MSTRHRPASSAAPINNCNCDCAVLGDQQRRLQQQLIEPIQPGLGPSRQRHLHERGTRQQRDIKHRVIGQPRMSLGAEPPTEQPTLLITDSPRRPRTGGRPAPTPPTTHPPPRGPGTKPIPLPLKGIRGQRHPRGVMRRQHRRPIHAHPVHVGLGQGGQEASPVAFVAAQRSQHADRAGVLAVGFGGFVDRHRQHRVRTHFDKAACPRLEQVAVVC